MMSNFCCYFRQPNSAESARQAKPPRRNAAYWASAARYLFEIASFSVPWADPER
jgi:hypothetical protein